MNVLIVPSSLPSLPPCCVIIGRKAAGDLNFAAWLTAGFEWRFSAESRPSRVGDSLLRPHDGDDRDMASLFTDDS